MRVRGYAIDADGGFRGCLDALFDGPTYRSYAGGVGYKRALSSGLYSSTVVPSSLQIPVHNELAYVRDPPRHVAFYGQVAARSGGATTVVRGRDLVSALPAEIADAFRRRRLCYTRSYQGEGRRLRLLNRRRLVWMSWQQALETRDRGEAQARCEAMGARARWSGGVLRMTSELSAFRPHPDTGEPCWFNHLLTFAPSPISMGWPVHLLHRATGRWLAGVRFADGEPVPRRYVEAVALAARANLRLLTWRRGDVVVLDNHLLQHGRMPYRGPRDVRAAMLR